MRAHLQLCALLLALLSGCVSDQQLRPCGPGYLGNILIPQGFCGADFRGACRRHDNCYGSNCPRKVCDDRFLNDMLGACQCSHSPGLCRLRAYQWYWQVRLLGGPGYQSEQQARCRRCGSGACGQAGCGACGGCQGGANCGCASAACEAPSCTARGCTSCGCGSGGCGAPSCSQGCCAGGQAATAEQMPLQHFSYDAERLLGESTY